MPRLFALAGLVLFLVGLDFAEELPFFRDNPRQQAALVFTGSGLLFIAYALGAARARAEEQEISRETAEALRNLALDLRRDGDCFCGRGHGPHEGRRCGVDGCCCPLYQAAPSSSTGER